MLVDKYQHLSKVIAYEFKDRALLELAFTHRSAAKQHNERLEFLGDAVLGMVIAEILYEKFPTQPEGKLTRMRSSLVKGETLAKIAQEHDLGKLIKLGSGEMKSGGNRRASTLADVVESILGAIYLEAGLEVVRLTIDKLWRARIDKLDPNIQIKDNKTQLQEYLQSRQLPLPEYEVIEIKGKDHNQTFRVSCKTQVFTDALIGEGKSRRFAEQDAAQQTLEKILDAK